MPNLYTHIPNPLPAGRQVLQCCVPGCENVDIHNLEVERCRCHFHAATRDFPREVQTDMELEPAAEEAAA